MATWLVDPVLVAVKEPMLPVPLAANPMEVLLLVQAYDVAVPEKLIAEIVPPLHAVLFVIVLTEGTGFTVTVMLVVVPAHPFAVGVIR